MQHALFEQRIADIGGLLILQTLAFAKRQARLAMRVPCGLEAEAGVAALAQGEPGAVLDRPEVRSLADPDLARCCAADDVDARNGLPRLVGGDVCFPVDAHGGGALLRRRR